ncbi:MAG: patatin-like phospholipase family protein [Bacteriovorax sp.]|nr:patatin-like phospholipase family protein [Bacteriovorax sp.]
MNKALTLLSIILILSSCSSVKTINTHDQKKSSTIPDKVDFDPYEHAHGPVEKPIDIIVPQEETVRIGERGGDIYANSDLGTVSGHVENKKLRIGLSLGPGIYRTINYVSLLKILERQNLAPDIITGTGFGAIVAAMYATGMTPEVIEWNFYKYFKEKKKNKPYEKDWINEIDEMFLTKFKNINIQDTKKKFFITLYDHNTKKTYYFDKGNIRDLLLLNLRLSNNFKESKSSQKYSTAFEKEVFNARLLRQLGAEFTIAVDVLGARFDFETTNEFLIGVYGRTAGRIQKERKDFDYSVTLPLNLMSLDSTKDSSFFMQKTYDFMQKQSPLIFKKIQAKLDSLSHSGNE